MAKPDLNKLKSEIDSRKRERNMTSSSLGESVGSNIAPRDSFLNGLLKSLETGQNTASTNLIKLVENKVAVKNKETIKHQIDEAPVREPARIPILPTNNKVEMSPERDEQLFLIFKQKILNKHWLNQLLLILVVVNHNIQLLVVQYLQ